jgi:hypothetical protein
MKKFVMSLVAAFAISPVMAEDSVNLAGLGLGNLQPVSEEAGMEVRGLSASAQGMSMATATLLLIDPNSGSKVSFDASSFNFASDENAGVDEVGTTSTAANLVFPALSLDTDNEGVTFAGDVTTGALFSQGQGAGGGATGFTFTLPTFDLLAL